MKLEKKALIKRSLLFVLGLILTPILLTTFIIDRFLMIFLVMGHGPDIVEYFQDMKYIGISTLRTFIVAIVGFFIWWLCR
tara:strand:+ start:3071 stop:3310 length:240 start_codon:yes stop_codon:yes gene_type:complete